MAASTTYRVLAVLLVIGVLAALFIGFTDTSGPGVFEIEPAIVTLFAGLGVVALVLFFFLLRIGDIFAIEKRLNATIEREAARLAKMANGRRETVPPAAAAPVVRRPAPMPTPAPVPMTAAPVTNVPLTATDERQHVITIEGIGTKYAARLNAMGIISIPQLLRADVARVATNIQVEPDLVREWQDMGNLMRLKGVGPQSAEVLVLSGIRTIDQLAKTSPEAVATKVMETESKHKTRIQGQNVTPGVAKRWVDAAKKREFDANA